MTFPPIVTAPPDLIRCSSEELTITRVHSGVALGTTYSEYGITTNSDTSCALPAPSAMRFEDASGRDIGIPVGPGIQCGSKISDPYCVATGNHEVSSGEPSRVNADEPDVAISVAHTTVQLFEPCESPNVQAATLGFVFDGVGDLRVPLDHFEINPCYPGVGLFAFN